MSNLYKSVVCAYIFLTEVNPKSIKATSKRLLFLVVFFSFILSPVKHLYSHHIIEQSFAIKTQASSLIVEAKIIQKQSFWNDANNRIYTANEIEIYKVFKGQVSSRRHYVITQGGTIGNDKLEVIPSLQLTVGEIGVFMLENSTAQLSSVNGIKLDPVAEEQAFYRYDEISGKALSPFDNYHTVTALHNDIQVQANQLFNEIYPYTFEKIQFPESVLPPQITAISPTNLNGGVGDVLTITGTGFGVQLLTSKVMLYDADVGPGVFWEDVTTFITWTDTLIRLTVPNRGDNGKTVGSGNVQVQTQLGSSISSQVLTINYNHINILNQETQHMDKNGLGGYTFTFNNAFESTVAGSEAAFTRALENWRCATRVNWDVDAINTPIASNANDGVSVVAFVSTISSLATAYSWYSNCGGNNWYVTEMDIEFNTAIPWYTDTTMPLGGNADLESVALHELGHSHQLTHVRDQSDPLYWSIGFGQAKRSLLQNNIDGGIYVKDKSVNTSICGQPAMIMYPQCPQPLSCSVSITNAPAIVCNADSTMIYADVTITGGAPVVSNNFNYLLSFNGASVDSVVNTTDTSIFFPMPVALSGNYLVTVVDDSTQCIASDSLTLNIPFPLALSTSVSYTSALGACDGSGVANIAGGIPPYSYEWNDASANVIATTTSVSNLCTGTYTVCVTDALGCQVCDIIQIFSGGCTLFTSTNTSFCDGDSTAITAIMLGGGGGLAANAFEFELLDMSGNVIAADYNADSTSTFYISTAGTFVLQVSNTVSGCIASDTLNFISYPAVSVSITSGNTSLPGACDGYAQINTSSGTSPFAYQWDTSGVLYSNNATIQNICEGWYNYTVTDANGCSSSDSIEIILVPCDLDITLADPILCHGDDDARIKINVIGSGAGSIAYTVRYLYSLYTANPTQLQGFIASNIDSVFFSSLPPATYFFTVYDSSYGAYCTTDTLVVTEPPPLNAYVSVANATNLWTCDGNMFIDSVSGGIFPWSSQWFDANNNLISLNPFLNNVCSGTYQLNVTDANGCIDTTYHFVPAGISCDSLAIASTQTNNVLCSGDSTGSIIIFPDSVGVYSVPPLNYIFTNISGDTLLNQTSSFPPFVGALFNQPPGDYFVSLTDSNGCNIQESFEILENNQLIFDLGDDVIIPCGSDTILQAGQVVGGVGNYNFLWQPTSSTADTTIAYPGTTPVDYVLTITDSVGCSVKDTVNVSWDLYVIEINSVLTTNVSCFGDSTGLISVVVDSSTGFGSYFAVNQFSGISNTIPLDSSFVGLPSDTFIINIVDSIGCLSIDSTVILTQPSVPLTTTATDSSFTCYFDSIGLGIITALGGTPYTVGDPYSYVWEDINGVVWSINDTVIGLPAGTYYATTTDSLACFVIDTMQVLEPSNSINLDSIAIVDVHCKYDSTGSISVSFSGGFIPYNVILILGSDTMHTQGLIDSAITISGLPYGNYDLLVYDSINCINVYNAFINEPLDTLSSSIHTLTDVSCWGDSTGQAIVTVIGGQFPYTHLWSNGETNALNATLNAGWHYVTSTDANGCIIEDSVEIFHINPLIQGNINIVQNVSCFNGCDGIATITSVGGVLPHRYSWSNGQLGTFQPDTTYNLCYGSYYVIIEDAVGCRVLDSVFISQPDELKAQASFIAHITCNGFDNGIAYATATGGTLPYSFVWDSINGQVGDSAFNLTPGVHTVYLTDDKGCTALDTVVITEPDVLEVEIIDSLTVLPYCTGVATASLTATTWGGTKPYNYSWSLISGSGSPLNQFDSVATNLLAGIYSVIVMDERNCIASDTMDIDTVTNTMDGYVTSDSISCFGANDGSAQAIVWGAHSPYTYQWFGPLGYSNTGQAINSLLFGTYSVIVNDTNDCEITRFVDVKQPDKLEYTTYHVIDESCDGSCDGQVYVDISGGTGPFRYEWNNSNGNSVSFVDNKSVINDSIIPNLCSAEYDFYITDTNNCQGYVLWGGRWQEIVSPLVTVGGLVDDPNSLVHSNCFNTPNGSASVLNPNPNYSYVWQNIQAIGTVVDSGTTAYNLAGGTYQLLTYYGDSAGYYLDYLGCTDTSAPFTINQPLQITPQYNIDHVDCFDDNDGRISITNIFGGLGNFSAGNFDVLWNPNMSTNNTINNLIAGTYAVSITDTAGCEFVDTVIINEPDPLTTDIAVTDVICNGDPTGTAVVTPVGGTAPYIEDWNGENPNALAVGVYPVTVTDDNGCQTIDTAIINQPLAIIAQAIVSSDYSGADISCNGLSDGEAAVNLSGGGFGNLTYDWQPGGQTTSTATNLSAGNYTVTVSDDNGCTESASVTLTDPAVLLANISFDENITCFNACDGWAEATPTGGTVLSVSNYQYSWTNSPGVTISGQSRIEDLCAGNSFSVLVEDANGCQVTASTPLFTEPAEIIANITASDTGAAHPPFAVEFISSTMPVAAYNYIYNVNLDGVSVQAGLDVNNPFWITFTNPGANMVTFLVEDQVNAGVGCYDTITMTIHVQGVDVPNVFTPNGDGTNDYFVVDNHGIETLNMLIFNRWGAKVYEWNTTQTAWDGTGLDGEDVADGVYYYILTAVGEDGYPYEERGAVTLIR